MATHNRRIMAKRALLFLWLVSIPLSGGAGASAQDNSRIQVNVVLVQLSVAMTDRQGNYPRVSLLNKAASDSSPFSQAPVSDGPDTPGVRVPGANVFILFDTSNYMYRGFVFAQDAIADFVRSLEGVNKVAMYSYSRNLSRVAVLTPDRAQVLRGVRNTVAGDDAALYNSLLLTVKDAAPLTGRKAIVVFSNGPDKASLVSPEDVAGLGQLDRA